MGKHRNNKKDKKLKKDQNKQNDENIIFRPYTTTRNGRKIFAKDYGLKAFKIKL